jgi:putative transposase
VARCTVERLMRAAGLRGITRAKGARTTVPARGPDTRPDLVERDFTAEAPNRLWVCDITYCRTSWNPSVLRLGLRGLRHRRLLPPRGRLAAVEVAAHRPRPGRPGDGDLDPHPRRARRDRPDAPQRQRSPICRYSLHTQRLAEAGVVASVGSTGDSYDNAAAEAFNSLFKAELVRNKGPWKTIDDLEIATAEYIDWFNHRRLHGEIGMTPPAEFEDTYYRHNTAPATVEASVHSLH